MKKIFKCVCKDHLLEIKYSNSIEWTNIKTKKKHRENVPELGISIYELHGGKSGRKLKKPKLIADVLFTGEDVDGKELDFLIKFLDNITMAYILRKK